MKINFVLSILIWSLIAAPTVSLAQAMVEEIPPSQSVSAVNSVDPISESAVDPISQSAVNSAPGSADTISSAESSIFSDPAVSEPAGNAQCFDYYQFGSVITDISSTLPSTVDGAAMTFVGTMTNQNPYPLTGLDLYVKIFRKQSKEADALNNAHHLVAQFVAVDNISITAKGEREFSFDWLVPPGTIPGDYMIATYAMTNEAYNLSGLSFTDDVTGASAQFKIDGEDTGSFAFDKNKVKMNDTEFRFASMIPTFTKDKTVTITVPYVNNTKSDKEVEVLWKQYNWDGLNEQALLNVKSETFTVPAGKSKLISYSATEYKGAVTYIVADAESDGVHSILDMRFARIGVEQARINFPSITSFPLIAGQPNSLFSCLHVAGPDTLSGATLDLTLTDKNGAIITQNKYEGNVTSAMMGVKYDFTPTANYDQVTLTATLERNGVVEDIGKVTYDCQAIDASLCLAETGNGSGENGNNGANSTHNTKLVMLILILGILAIVGIFFSLKRRHNSQLPPLPPLAILLVFLFSFTFFNFGPQSVLAKSVSWTSGTFDAYGYDGVAMCKTGRTASCAIEPEIGSKTPGDGLGPYFEFGWTNTTSISNAVATINYNTTANYEDGANVTVGDTINFSPLFTSSDINFNGTGSYSDSPIGTWSDSSLNYQNIGGTYSGPQFGQIDYLAALWVNKPSPTVTKTGGTGTASCSGLSCTVTAAGTLQFRVNYPAVVGGVKMGFRKQLRGTGPNIWYEAGTTHVPLLAVKGTQTGCPTLPRTEAEDKQCYNAAYSNRFILSVPTQNINFSFTGVAANKAPNPPTITNVTIAPAGSSSVFSFKATDPDGDNLRYEIDWDKNGTVDAYAPSSGTVTSGTARNGSRTWAAAGTYTFQARTYANGQSSTWTTHTVTIPAAPVANVNIFFKD